MAQQEAILQCWFGEARDDQAYYEERHSVWFAADPVFDQTVREHFLADYHLAAEGKLMAWQDAPHPGLALILLLDQFPRNMFRGDARAFVTDPLARAVATHLIHIGFDQRLLPVERSFVYMPFMHSEHLEDQRQSVALFGQLAQERSYLSSLSYAVRHLEVVARFGRFPHRNAILGRPSTAEEVAFLTQPDSSF